MIIFCDHYACSKDLKSYCSIVIISKTRKGKLDHILISINYVLLFQKKLFQCTWSFLPLSEYFLNAFDVQSVFDI